MQMSGLTSITNSSQQYSEIITNTTFAVSSAGDVNGDGIDDIIVGAYKDDDGGEDSGCAFIFFGSATPSAIIDASNANVKLIGADIDDEFSSSVAGAK